MAKREFSAKRLFKLLRFLVIVISLLSVIVAIYQLRYYKYSQRELLRVESEYQALPELLPPAPASVDKEYDKNQRKKEVLLNKTFFLAKAVTSAREKSVIFSAIAILLPVIFFGGIGIYKYLFPVKRED